MDPLQMLFRMYLALLPYIYGENMSTLSSTMQGNAYICVPQGHGLLQLGFHQLLVTDTPIPLGDYASQGSLEVRRNTRGRTVLSFALHLRNIPTGRVRSSSVCTRFAIGGPMVYVNSTLTYNGTTMDDMSMLHKALYNSQGKISVYSKGQITHLSALFTLT